MNDPALPNKQRAARAALTWLRDDMILGVGTGSTVNALLDLLVSEGAARRLRGAVASSEASAARLRAAGVALLDLNELDGVPLYLDGADEATRGRQLIKGGGGALTREKILAAAARCFVCIIDEGKLVDRLGRFPLPVEVIPMARAQVARHLTALGGRPVWREGFTTDNGNHILDVHGLTISDAVSLETTVNQIAGVVTVGLFASRPADVLLVGAAHGVQTI
ncbi:MAG TPA: ribose-5-phosphate isomerase RpiA [Steroidobacteraceae bacterium]|nr:ribose-5-phosphate isomerase RpiA [Steroidobacteraceae bacterium]